MPITARSDRRTSLVSTTSIENGAATINTKGKNCKKRVSSARPASASKTITKPASSTININTTSSKTRIGASPSRLIISGSQVSMSSRQQPLRPSGSYTRINSADIIRSHNNTPIKRPFSALPLTKQTKIPSPWVDSNFEFFDDSICDDDILSEKSDETNDDRYGLDELLEDIPNLKPTPSPLRKSKIVANFSNAPGSNIATRNKCGSESSDQSLGNHIKAMATQSDEITRSKSPVNEESQWGNVDTDITEWLRLPLESNLYVSQLGSQQIQLMKSDLAEPKTLDQRAPLQEKANENSLGCQDNEVIKHEFPLVFTAKGDMVMNEYDEIKHIRRMIETSSPDDLTQQIPEKDSSGNNDTSGLFSDIHTAMDSASKTYQDLLNTLQLLDDEETQTVLHKKQKLDRNVTSFISDENEMEIGVGDNYKTTNLLDTLEPVQSTKIREIHCFLDEIEETDKNVLEELRSMAHIRNYQNTSLPSDVKQPTELEKETESLNLHLEEKTKCIAILKRALNHERELHMHHVANSDKETKKKIKSQKEEYELSIKRQQDFIDQLLKDKKLLNEKCEKLISEMRNIGKKHEETIRAVEERHVIELKRVREMHEVAEKIRREKWVEVKTKKIKEMTVRGLEPEIEKMLSKHKHELNELKANHQQDLLSAEERVSMKYIKEIEELRKKWLVEKEDTLAKDREIVRQSYEQQLQQAEQSYLLQRGKLHSEIEQERDKVLEIEKELNVKMMEAKQKMEEQWTVEKEAIEKEYKDKEIVNEKRYQSELQNVRDTFEIEKESLTSETTKMREQMMINKEKELREMFRKERDSEIEVAIERLENESTQAVATCQKQSESKLKRLREKFEVDILELESLESSAREKYKQLKSKLLTKEDDYITLENNYQTKVKELEDINQITNKLQEERRHLSEIIGNEYSSRILHYQKEIATQKAEIEEIKARHVLVLERVEIEKEDLQKQKGRELEEVHKRVIQALSRKDENINELIKKHEKMAKKCDHLEKLLEQQRMNFLLK